MESNGTSIFVVIFLAVLILSAVLIVWMFVSLSGRSWRTSGGR